MEYGQFCPLAKAMEILGEKWTMLILREMHMGATRFNELQRGLSSISPTILTKRLSDLADTELILRKKIRNYSAEIRKKYLTGIFCIFSDSNDVC